MIQAELKVVGGKHDGKVIPLAVGKFLVGREKDCHLRPNSEMVSRHHCVFTTDDYTVRLRDLGSTNGTTVNGERIRGEVVLKPGDHVSFGKLEFEVLIGAAAHATSAPAVSEDTAELSGSQTMFALPTAEPAPSVQGADTAVISPSAPETFYEQPVYDPAMYPQAGYDPAQGYDPNAAYAGYAAAGGYAMPGYPGAPAGAEWPAGYPGYAPQPAYPGYPPVGGMYGQGYPGVPAGYPVYPQPGYPAAGYPQGAGMPGAPMPGAMMPGSYPAAPSAPPAPSGSPAGGPMMAGPAGRQVVVPPMRLPNPEETGAVAPAAPAAPPAGAAPAAEVKPSNSAADIIKAYRQRR